MKWTDSMVKLLITAASYTGEDPGADSGGGRRNCAMMQKKGKWKAISKVMGERGCLVSPQQCEDKFNDLNKGIRGLQISLVGVLLAELWRIQNFWIACLISLIRRKMMQGRY